MLRQENDMKFVKTRMCSHCWEKSWFESVEVAPLVTWDAFKPLLVQRIPRLIAASV